MHIDCFDFDGIQNFFLFTFLQYTHSHSVTHTHIQSQKYFHAISYQSFIRKSTTATTSKKHLTNEKRIPLTATKLQRNKTFYSRLFRTNGFIAQMVKNLYANFRLLSIDHLRPYFFTRYFFFFSSSSFVHTHTDSHTRWMRSVRATRQKWNMYTHVCIYVLCRSLSALFVGIPLRLLVDSFLIFSSFGCQSVRHWNI